MPEALGVKLTPANEAPPVPRDGMHIGVTTEGLVRLTFSAAVEYVCLTPDQAHGIGRELLKQAKKARKRK